MCCIELNLLVFLEAIFTLVVFGVCSMYVVEVFNIFTDKPKQPEFDFERAAPRAHLWKTKN